MNVFDEYEAIENHIRISKHMHYLNMKGKFILTNLGKKKQIRQNKNGNYVLSKDVSKIYMVIEAITNIKRFNKLRLYFCLQYYLDEMLFYEVKKLDRFEIEDDSYNLVDIYFNQNTWYPLYEEDIYIISFDEDKTFNTDENRFLKDYFHEQIFFIKSILDYMKKKILIDRISKKLMHILKRINNKILKGIDLLLETSK